MLKAEYIMYQNVVLNWQDCWTIDQLCATEHRLLPSWDWRLLWEEAV